MGVFFFSSRRRHTRLRRDWSSDVCSSDLIDTGNMISTSYLGDLTDEEMMHRPHPDCNHIKWQMGHLIVSEHNMVDSLSPGCMPPLPEGFADKYTKETAASDDAAAFDSKEELMRLYEQQRAGTLAALEQTETQQLSNEPPARKSGV